MPLAVTNDPPVRNVLTYLFAGYGKYLSGCDRMSAIIGVNGLG